MSDFFFKVGNPEKLFLPLHHKKKFLGTALDLGFLHLPVPFYAGMAKVTKIFSYSENFI